MQTQQPSRRVLGLWGACTIILWAAALLGADGPAPVPAAPDPAVLDQAFNPGTGIEFGTEPSPLYTTLQTLKPGVPDDEAKAGWEQLLANDFKASRASFEKVLAAKPGQKSAVAGLGFINLMEGRDADSTDMYLARIRATAGTAEGLLTYKQFMNWGGAPLDAGMRAAKLQLELIRDPQTDPGLRTILASSMVNHPRDNHALTGETADELFKISGWIPQYQVTFGPFGMYYNDFSGGQQVEALLQRPFAPESGLGNLDFKDTPPKPGPTLTPKFAAWPRVVIKNPETIYGTLLIGDQIPTYRHTAIFYTLTNLDCPQATDAIVLLEGLDDTMVYLNGYPIWSPEVARAAAPNLYSLSGLIVLKVRLGQGNNPILIKHAANDSHFSIRVLNTDWQLIPGLAYKALTDEELAKVSVVPVRGRIVAQPVMTADMAFLCGSKTGVQVRQRLGDLIAVAANADVATVPMFCHQLLDRGDYLSALALTESLRKTYPQAVYALYLEAYLQRAVVQAHMAADGRYGVTARATLDQLAKQYPGLFVLRKDELSIAQERNDPEKSLALARALTAQFPDVPQSHLMLAQIYQQRQWVPETEAEIANLLDLYSRAPSGMGAAAGANDPYPNRALPEAHRFASDFHHRDGKQATYLKLREENHKAERESSMQWAMHLLNEGQPAEGLKVLQDDLPRWPKYKRQIGQQIAQYQRQLGNLDAYRVSLDEGLTRNPYNAELLEERIENSVRLGLTKEALADLDDFIQKFDATETLLRLQLDLRHEDPMKWFKPFDVADSEVSPKDYTSAKYKSASVATLVDLQVVRFLPDTSCWVYSKSSTEPLVTNAVDSVSRQRTGSMPSLLEIRSTNKDGKSYIPEVMSPGSAEMYNVEASTVITRDSLQFTAANRGNPSIDIEEEFRKVDSPIGIKRLTLIVPAALESKLKFWYNLPDEIKHTRTVQGDDVIHSFENTTHEPLHHEDNMSEQDLVPRVEIYTDDSDLFHDAELLQAVAPSYQSQLVVQTAQAIVAGLPKDADDLQKFDALVKWVRTELKPGQGPDTFDDMIMMKAADDHPSRQELVHAFAHALHLNVSSLVQVATYNPFRTIAPKAQRRVYTPGSLLQAGDAGFLVLQDASGVDHFRAVLGQQAQYYSTIPPIPAALDSRSPLLSYVMTAAPMGSELRRFEGVQPVADNLRIQLQIAVQPNNEAQLLGRAFVYGSASGSIRERRTDKQNRQMLDNNLARWFWPQMAEQNLQYLNDQDAERPLEVTVTGKIGRLGQTDPDGSISVPALVAPGRNNLSSIIGIIGKTEREYEYVLPDHVDNTQSFFMPVSLAYIAPPGWCWSEVPEDLMLSGEFGWYYCNFQVLGSRLEIHRGFMLPKQRLTPDQWKRLNAFLGAIRNYETVRKTVCRPLPAGMTYSTDCLSAGSARTDLSW